MRIGTVKSALVALAVLVPSLAQAGSAEEAYFAARDAAIATVSAGSFDEALNDKSVAALKVMMQGLIGPVSTKGLTASVQLHADTLVKSDEGFGMLDGLVYTAVDKKTLMIVTTEGLLAHWLAENAERLGNDKAQPPPATDTALGSDAFYAQAFLSDSATSVVAEVPVALPAGASFAAARLIGRSQFLSNPPPDELFVTMVRGGRVFIVDAPVAARLGPIPACDAVAKAAEATTKGLNEAAEADPKNEALADKAVKSEQDGDDAYHRCFAEKAKDLPAFVRIVRQAAALMALLPPK